MASQVTAAELRARQQQSERRSAEEQTAEQERRREVAQREAEKQQEALALQIRGAWNSLALQASQRDGVRFVVLARVIYDATPPFLEELAVEAAQTGFTFDLATLFDTDPKTLHDHMKPAHLIGGRSAACPPCEVYDNKHPTSKGWYPGPPMTLGTDGRVKYLIVRW
jgi:hypothetical protein